MKKVKYIFILVLFVVSCYYSWKLYLNVYIKEDTVNIHTFPKEFDGWSSKELTITDKEYEILETRNAFVREYSNDTGQTVFFFTVYSQNNRKVSHPPEICYTGNGMSVLENTEDAIAVEGQEVPVHELLLEHARYQQVAYYWFKVGDTFTNSYWKQQALIVWKSLIGEPASSALIRISATIKDGNKGQAEKALKDFSQSMVPELFKYLP
ncbi:MAG: EpsI family protein [Candidatus Omnitrophica bacterium]|nr:EpsI family protein [Candidatus Omnitrophota bacterium]